MAAYTVYFDLETGGVEMRHPVIQLAAIAVDESLTECGTFEEKIAFKEETADHEALRINHYSAESWKNALSPLATVNLFNMWLKPFSSVSKMSQRGMPYVIAKLAGFNAVMFDAPRLKALYAGQFFPCSYQVRDVMQRAFFYFDKHYDEPQPKDYKLTTLCDYFGIVIDGAHDALTDVRLTIALAKALRGDVWL